MFDKRYAAYGSIWEADKTSERLIRQGLLRPLILVGIDNNSQREEEYTLQRDNREKRGGNARNYGKFITEELKPFIDSNYHIKPGPENCGIAGSSLGGLFH
jgi:predicted alpha/beta superfamily hydrolase